METQQLKLGDKVKMKLVQPTIMCAGRKPVTCHYKGEVVAFTDGPSIGVHPIIRFKTNRGLVEVLYNEDLQQIVTEGYKDIKLM
jgi:hypothetical protein